MKVIFDPCLPEHLLPMLEAAWARFSILIPPHMERVCFNWYPESEAGMACDHDQEYRILEFHITAHSIKDDETLARYMRHEIAHWFNQAIAKAAERCIKEIVGSDYPTPGSKVADAFLAHVLEESNTDLEQTFKRVLGQ